MRKLIPLLLLALPLPAFAQSVITIDTQQCVYHAGDNTAWAALALDESDWRPYSEWMPTLGQPRIWVRCHVDLSSFRALPRTAIQVRLHSSYQLYFNGVPIGGSGNLSSGNFSLGGIRTYPIPGNFLSYGAAIISLRLTSRDLTSIPPQIRDSLETRVKLLAGDRTILDALRAQTVMARDLQFVWIALCYGAIGVVGAILLCLFSYDRSRHELLQFGIACLALAVVRVNEFCAASQLNYPFTVCLALQVSGTIVFTVALLLFVFALARRRVPLYFWIFLTATIFFFFPSAFDVFTGNSQLIWLESQHRAFIRALDLISELAVSVAPFFAFWPYTQVAGRMRSLAGLCMLLGTANVVYYTAALTAVPLPGIPNLFTHWGFTILEVRAFVVAGVIAAILALLFREQRQITEDRALLAGELQAASQIQRMLAPATLVSAPGLHIEVAFHPMREVGGDFYLCRVLPDGTQRVLLGDVSGKGSAAAMTAALLLGGAADHESESPAALVAHLNRVLLDSKVGGFATCLCVDSAPDGNITLANAGHLPPYHRGNEIPVPSGLPLGLTQQENSYQEINFSLPDGDTLTFLSDGVVEARNATGELFGFDRTRAISGQPASDIAEAAKNFGQDDDITVLTITRKKTDAQSLAEQAERVLAPA
jgi:Stage II sporulation protein E (SpoIIE)